MELPAQAGEFALGFAEQPAVHAAGTTGAEVRLHCLTKTRLDGASVGQSAAEPGAQPLGQGGCGWCRGLAVDVGAPRAVRAVEFEQQGIEGCAEAAGLGRGACLTDKCLPRGEQYDGRGAGSQCGHEEIATGDHAGESCGSPAQRAARRTASATMVRVGLE